MKHNTTRTASKLEYSDAGAFRRLVRRSAGMPPVRWLYMRIQDPSDRLVYRLTRGRSTLSCWLSGLPIAMLTTTGARSGQPRTVPVLAIPDGNAVVVIASNFGRPRHPAWYRNLQAHPRATITVAQATSDVEADELHGPTREHALHRGIEMFPPFAGYQTRAAQRLIPVLRLNPVATRQQSASSAGTARIVDR